VKENQGTLAQAYDFISGIVKKRGVIPTPETPAAPLPPINE
jgi:hypothetical protein